MLKGPLADIIPITMVLVMPCLGLSYLSPTFLVVNLWPLAVTYFLFVLQSFLHKPRTNGEVWANLPTLSVPVVCSIGVPFTLAKSWNLSLRLEFVPVHVLAVFIIISGASLTVYCQVIFNIKGRIINIRFPIINLILQIFIIQFQAPFKFILRKIPKIT